MTRDEHAASHARALDALALSRYASCAASSASCTSRIDVFPRSHSASRSSIESSRVKISIAAS